MERHTFFSFPLLFNSAFGHSPRKGSAQNEEIKNKLPASAMKSFVVSAAASVGSGRELMQSIHSLPHGDPRPFQRLRGLETWIYLPTLHRRRGKLPTGERPDPTEPSRFHRQVRLHSFVINASFRTLPWTRLWIWALLWVWPVFTRKVP